MSIHHDFFPYPVLSGAHALEMHLDAGPLGPACVNGLAEIVDAPPGARFTWSIQVTIPEQSLRDVLPPSELAGPPIRVMVLVESVTARARSAITLGAGAHPGVFVGEWDQSLDASFGDISLTPVVVRAAAGSDPSFADETGAMILRGMQATVRCDPRARPLGETLDVRFVDFLADPSLSDRSDQLYAIDFVSSPPVILLNSAVNDLKRIMKSEARRGYEARIRTAIYPAIAAQVWTSLAGVALDRFRSQLLEDDEAVDGSLEARLAAFELMDDWEQSVLRYLCPKVYELSADDAVQAVAAALIDGRAADFFSRLADVVQHHVASRSGYDALLILRSGTGI